MSTPSFPQIPYSGLAAHPSPHVLANGNPSRSTVFSLLGPSCPPEFRSTTATEAAVKFLKDNAAAAAVAKKQAAVAAAVPTFDGVAAVALLSSPELVSNAKMLIAVARGGLLNAYPSRQSARAGMALTMATNPVASPFPKEAFLSDSSDLTVYLVPLLKDLVKSNSESHKDLWTAEDALYASTLDAIKKDVIKVEVYDNFDLAVVEIPAEVPKYHEGALMSEIVYPGSAAGNGDAPAAVADADPVESKAPGRVLVNHGNETTFSYTQLSTIRLLAHPDSASRQHDLKPLTDLLNSYERKVPPGPGGTTFWELAKDGKGFRCRGSGLQWSLVKDRVLHFFSDKAAASHGLWASITGSKAI